MRVAGKQFIYNISTKDTTFADKTALVAGDYRITVSSPLLAASASIIVSLT